MKSQRGEFHVMELVVVIAIICIVLMLVLPAIVYHREKQEDQARNEAAAIAGEIERVDYYTEDRITVIRWKDGRTSILQKYLVENPVPSGVRARVLWEEGKPTIVPVLIEKP